MLLAMLFVLGGVSTADRVAAAQAPTPTIERGAIAGRIVTDSSEPVPWIVVSALKQDTDAAGRVMARTAAMTQTNELGEFRLAGLSPGNYVVIAAPQPPPPFGPPPRPAGALVPVPTYYPGTASTDAAQIITIASGQLVSDLQFSMASTPSYNVTGVVLDEAGSPLSSVVVTLMIDVGSGGIGAPMTGRSDDHGTFHLSGVAPGSYRLLAGTPMMTTTREGSTTIVGLVGGGVAVTGGVFVGGPGVSATGGPSTGAPGVGGPGVLPPTGRPTTVATPTMISTPIDVTVGNNDVAGLRLVVSSRK